MRSNVSSREVYGANLDMVWGHRSGKAAPHGRPSRLSPEMATCQAEGRTALLYLATALLMSARVAQSSLVYTVNRRLILSNCK